jgi:hypothetical protein
VFCFPAGYVWVPDKDTFRAGAGGSVLSSSNQYDIWEIDQDKALVNSQPGL